MCIIMTFVDVENVKKKGVDSMSMTVTESWPVLCSDVESEPCSDSLRRCQPRSILILVFIIYVFYRKIP